MKKHLEALLGHIGRAVKYRYEQLRTNLPGRMTIGKFGILLVEVGRFLQTRYANWNGEFRLKREFHPNPDCCTLHVSDRVTEHRILTFDSLEFQKDKQTPMVVELFGIEGVCGVILMQYQVSLTKGNVFSWTELLPVVEAVVLRHLTAQA